MVQKLFGNLITDWSNMHRYQKRTVQLYTRLTLTKANIQIAKLHSNKIKFSRCAVYFNRIEGRGEFEMVLKILF